MATSILTETKKAMGLTEANEAFDVDIVMHINSVFADLNQIGAGPADGYAIVNKDNTWDEFTGDEPLLNMVMSYMYLRVKMLHDPFTIGRVIEAAEKQIAKWEWRIRVATDTPNLSSYSIIDGGSP